MTSRFRCPVPAGLLAAAALLACLQGAQSGEGALPDRVQAPAVLRPSPSMAAEETEKQQLPQQGAAPALRPQLSPAGADEPETERSETPLGEPPLPHPAPRGKLIPPPDEAGTPPKPTKRATVGKLIPPQRAAATEPATASQPAAPPTTGPSPQHAPTGKLVPPEPAVPPANTAQPSPPPREDAVPPEPNASPAEPASPKPQPAIVPEDGGKPAGPQAMPPEEVSCRARLRVLGAVFEERPPLQDPLGCGIAHPIAVTKLSPAIALQGEALLNCGTAEAAARFATNTIAPAARSTFGEELTEIAGISAYVCRDRNGTTKLSEHAFGNALDISQFVLSKGTRVDVTATVDPKHAGFLAAIRSAACGPFRTVLGPGSNADHATHLHLDLAPRRNDATYCH